MVHIKIDGVTVCYNSIEVLKNVVFEIEPGLVTAIIGPNGAGKTTLLRTIAGVLKPKRGVVYLDGKRLDELHGNGLAKTIGYMPQIHDIKMPMTVFEIVALGRKPYTKWSLSKRDLEVIWWSMNITGVEHLAYRRIDEVSGGERQRVMLARVLAQEPRILLLDEPVSNLDPRYQIEVLNLVKELTKKLHLTTVITLHDLNHVIRYADKAVMLYQGTVYAIGDVEQVLTPENICKVYGVDAEIIKNPIPAIIIKGVSRR
mgnify:CR=1 FL=1